MKNLELNQMENLNGGEMQWDWGNCASGALAGVVVFAESPSAWVTGWWGLGVTAAAGCVMGGLA